MVDLSLFVNVYQMVVGLCKPSPNGRLIELTLPESKEQFRRKIIELLVDLPGLVN